MAQFINENHPRVINRNTKQATRAPYFYSWILLGNHTPAHTDDRLIEYSDQHPQDHGYEWWGANGVHSLAEIYGERVSTSLYRPWRIRFTNPNIPVFTGDILSKDMNVRQDLLDRVGRRGYASRRLMRIVYANGLATLGDQAINEFVCLYRWNPLIPKLPNEDSPVSNDEDEGWNEPVPIERLTVRSEGNDKYSQALPLP